MGTIAENKAELVRLLGKYFIETSHSQHPIRKALNSVLEFHRQGDYARRDYVNTALSLLVNHLKEIENHDSDLLGLFRKALRNANEDTYFGIRFEVSIAASLIRHRIPFRKSEHPDFVLTDQLDGVFLECGSAHLTKPKPTGKDLKYKISSVVKDKAARSYCSTSTCLFIDHTNISYHSMTSRVLPTRDELKSYVADMMKDTHFGSVVLFSYYLDRDRNRYTSGYNRVDAGNANPLLLTLLNRVCPFGEVRTHDYGFADLF